MPPPVSDLARKYDVAISFRWQDIEVVRSLFDLLRERMEVFFADERFTEFVGTDGEESFAKIFGERSRVVVVFFRPGWGDAGFTMPEQAAIRNRAFTEGYGFTVWVPLTDPAELPPYIPRQHVYFDLKAYGVNGLAAVIEERVRESGVAVRAPSTLDEISTQRRLREHRDRRQAYLTSGESLVYARGEMTKIPEIARLCAARIAEVDERIVFHVSEREPGRVIALSLPRINVVVEYGLRNGAIGEGAFIRALLTVITDHRAQSRETRYELDMNREGEPGWSMNKKHLTTEQIFAETMEQLALEHARWMNRGTY